MLGQLDMFGNDKVETAIKRIKTFEPEEGYYLAFSGGKDSVVIKALADMAGVKYDAHYNVTSVDPPELVQFVKSFPDVEFNRPTYSDTFKHEHMRGKQITMWNLIPYKVTPPIRITRYCCFWLKEHGGEGRFVITGVRKSESVRRAQSRSGLELGDTERGERERLDPDNPSQELTHICPTKAQRILNPIIDWTTEEVWEFIHKYNVPYCELYDKGYTRLGCIGCCMSNKAGEELEKYPKIKQAYMRAFERMLKRRKERGLETRWQNAEEVYRWWLQWNKPDNPEDPEALEWGLGEDEI